MSEQEKVESLKEINLDDFPLHCVIQGCWTEMARSGEKRLELKRSYVYYEFWTCPKCGNTIRVCISRERKR